MIHRGKDAWNRLCSMCDDETTGRCYTLMTDISREGKQDEFNELFKKTHPNGSDDFKFWTFINKDSFIRRELGVSRHAEGRKRT